MTFAFRFKESVADVIEALEGILQIKSHAVLSMAASVAVNLVRSLPTSMLQSNGIDLIHPLSSCLSSCQSQVAVSCAIALNLILSNISFRRQKEVWEILKQTNTVHHIVSYINKFYVGNKEIEYFQEMVSLLATILRDWPTPRCQVWAEFKLMEVLEIMPVQPNFSVQAGVLQVYSSLALCGVVAKELLENEGPLLHATANFMGGSGPYSVRVAGFRLAQILAIREEGCLKMLRFCCEPIVEAVVTGMTLSSSERFTITNDQLSLLVEACRLALTTRWKGEHHVFFWEKGVDRVLVNLLSNKHYKLQTSSSLEKQMERAQEIVDGNFLLILRPYIWDILGSLSAHCIEDFAPNSRHESEHFIDVLITCACLVFVDSIRKLRLHQNEAASEIISESASRAVLMMMFSPCKYIASKAKLILSQILRPNCKEYLKFALDTINLISSIDKFAFFNNLFIVVNLIGLICYTALPEFQSYIIKNKGIDISFAFIRWCISNNVYVERSSIAPHLQNTFSKRMCCWKYSPDWEGRDIVLFFSLLWLTELIRHFKSPKGEIGLYSEAQLSTELQQIANDSFAPGPRWYAAYILTYFGLYGFPDKLLKRIGKSLNEEEFADIKLTLSTGVSVSVHGVILLVRCPSLLPPQSGKEICLSSHIDQSTLFKMLDFIYLGYLKAEEKEVKKLKVVARHCNLQPLLQMLSGKRPLWGTPYPKGDFTLALGPSGYQFSDIILEAKEIQVVHWACSFCSRAVPHMHCHKVILCSSCDYLRALFQSGMQESHSQIIKVPISWKALIRLVHWFYSDELPKPITGCLWDNMDVNEKLLELQPYVELCWLSEFWFLEDVHEDWSNLVISSLDSARDLSVKIIQFAAKLNQWELAKVAANYMALFYCALRDSGELEDLDEELVNMVRAASVRLSQEGSHH